MDVEKIFDVIVWTVVIGGIVLFLWLSSDGHKQELWNAISNRRRRSHGRGRSSNNKWSKKQ